jgi:hypothetical protein
MPARTELDVGDPVKLTDLGRRSFPKDPDRKGTVVAVSPTRTKCRVRWEGHATADYVHASYLELCE